MRSSYTRFPVYQVGISEGVGEKAWDALLNSAGQTTWEDVSLNLYSSRTKVDW